MLIHNKIQLLDILLTEIHSILFIYHAFVHILHLLFTQIPICYEISETYSHENYVFLSFFFFPAEV